MVSLFGRGFDSHQLHSIDQMKKNDEISPFFYFSFLVPRKLLLKIHSLHAIRHRRKNFVGNCAHLLADDADGQLLTENFDAVALVAVDSRDVDHRDIHANITHVVGSLSVHDAVAATVAELSEKAVGIADGNGSDDAVALQNSLATVADGIASRHVAQLQNRGF